LPSGNDVTISDRWQEILREVLRFVTGFFSPIYLFPRRPSASGTRIWPAATIG